MLNRKITGTLILLILGAAFFLPAAASQKKKRIMVSQEDLQRCVDAKKRKARKAGRPDHDIMEFRYQCYNELAKSNR